MEADSFPNKFIKKEGLMVYP